MSHPLRIALISEHASPLACLGGVDAGGQNIYVSHVAHELARRGHQVDVLTRRDDPTLPATVALGAGVRVVHVDAGPAAFVPKEALLPYMRAFSSAVLQLHRRGPGYDLVHANFFMSGLAGLRLKATFGVPLVVTFHALGLVRREHQGAADGFPAARIDIEQQLVREADRIVAECPQDRLDLQRLYQARSTRLAMVPCGVDLALFQPQDRGAVRAALGLADDEFVILQLGRMVPRKGVDNVIRALPLLPPKLRARLLVVGGESAQPDPQRTPEIGRLQALAGQCGVADRVTFLGHRQRHDLPVCYAASDVFVTTPWYEPFGITPLEAMACARPVVGSNVGGIRYSVHDGVTGRLVPPDDPPALARRLDELGSQPVLARAMGRAGMRRVGRMFTWERVAAELEVVYQDVVRRPAAVPVLHRVATVRPDAGTAAALPS